jgi:hypothetical protein
MYNLRFLGVSIQPIAGSSPVDGMKPPIGDGSVLQNTRPLEEGVRGEVG